MFRLLAILGLLAGFGAALYYSGHFLAAWESPQPAAKAARAPAPTKKAKRKHAARKARKPARREAAWLTELNALCRRGQAETDAIQPPASPEDLAPFFRKFEQKSIRLNRHATDLVQRSGNAKTASALRGLFDQEEALIHSMLAAAQKGEYPRLKRLVRSLLAVGKAENRVLARLGAVDCTVSPYVFDLY